MQENIQIQLPNPQQAIFNSQSYQTPPPSSGSTIFSLKNISIASLVFLVVGGIGMGIMSFKNAADTYNKKVSKRSQEIADILDEANSSAGLRVVGKAEASYDNPFDKNNSYENPFEEDENPF